MSAQSEQIKQNFLNHPYTQQASKFFNGQVSSLDAEVSYSVYWIGTQAHGQLNKYPVLRDIETRTKVPKAYGVLGLGVS